MHHTNEMRGLEYSGGEDFSNEEDCGSGNANEESVVLATRAVNSNLREAVSARVNLDALGICGDDTRFYEKFRYEGTMLKPIMVRRMGDEYRINIQDFPVGEKYFYSEHSSKQYVRRDPKKLGIHIGSDGRIVEVTGADIPMKDVYKFIECFNKYLESL